MKKLLCAAFAVLVLAGCSGGAKTETKTCSMEQSGMKMDATLTAEDDKI
ncbi:lipoprotein, partial [[Clostridium] innocuum]|nr:lipoprotein [[Clostridium] innocuum]